MIHVKKCLEKSSFKPCLLMWMLGYIYSEQDMQYQDSKNMDTRNVSKNQFLHTTQQQKKENYVRFVFP